MPSDRSAEHSSPAAGRLGLSRWRSRQGWPAVGAVVALLSALLGNILDSPVTGPLIVLALGLVGLATSRAGVRLTRTLGVFSGAVLAFLAFLTADADGLIAPISGFAIGMLPALIGEQLRAERIRARDANELARRVEELRDRDIGRAVAEERLRIARDVHDITGHHLSAISLQASGAGGRTADLEARASFDLIHGLTTEALGQTRRALGVLRQTSEGAALVPSPRLAHVEDLFAPARAAGIDVDLRVEGEPRELSETVEMCAFRVIQESLTNVARHAGARAVRVVVDYGATALRLAVLDDGSGAGPVRAGSGIEGMRERVAIVGGELAVGPQGGGGAGGGGGWAVRATLPLERRR
ncbi:histidine kinase [Conexibacter stalactiti]|uniref:histidine kinase n=1 Tax=Conexibacter stalactiti TaxID=1940611 RepID=A0ABU4HYB1_9ACTN|nr:histidine kinase [Conexibacter stalactiti]MDW5597049.1 histidine kinase [Conexibacter stalactiti]MEC5037691.1 histidine kinase [Conexibacter stalactiti]